MKYSKRWTGGIAGWIALLALVGTALADTRSFDIPAGELRGALDVYAQQAGVQLLYRVEDVQTLKTKGLHGTLDTVAALNKLLAGTPLQVHRDLSGALAITRSTADTPSPKSPHSNLNREYSGAPTASGAVANQASAEIPYSEKGKSPPGALTEIIVTAQKREERVFDVPISIVAISADELEKREVTSIDDLSLVVPGLAVASTGTYSRQIVIRGISNSTGYSSTIGMYLDEAPVTAAPATQPDLRTYDLDRVEVLRGPQGTLYGEGSMGGTIRFITKNPVLNSFAMNADVASIFTQDGSPGERIQGMINLPLIDNVLGLRFVGTFEHDGGWIDQPAAQQKDINYQDLTDVRIKGLWQPAANFTVNAMALLHRNEAPPNRAEDSNDNYTQVFNLTTTNSGEENYDLYNLTATYDFAPVRILSATSYIKDDRDVKDYGIMYQFTPPGTPQTDDLLPDYPISTKAVTEELRLLSLGSGPWQWTVGGFYRHFAYDDAGTGFYGVLGPDGAFTFQDNSLSKSWAVFGDTNYKFTGDLTVGAGLRYFSDSQVYSTGSLSARGPDQTGNFHSLDPRFYVQYKLTDQVNTYISAAKGFRSGGFNPLNEPAYGPEQVWTYELGTKIFSLDSHLSLETAIFYSNYTDYQVFGVELSDIAAGDITSNAGKARIKGLEWALTLVPVDQWILSLNGNYLDARFTEINATSTAYLVGDPLDNVPTYTVTTSVQRNFNWNGKSSFARLDYNRQGRETYRNRSNGPWYFSESDIIDMINFKAGLQWNENLSLGLFAQNILNNRGFLSPDTIEQLAARPRPRNVGIEFGVKF